MFNNNTLKRQISWLLILVTVTYLACFLFIFTFTKHTINTKVTNYLNSVSLRVKERTEAVIQEKINSLRDFSTALEDRHTGRFLTTRKELIELFTKYQFNRDYESLRYVDRECNSVIYFERGYLKEVKGGNVPDLVLEELEKCNANCHSVIAAGESPETFFIIYTPEYRTYESGGRKQSFVIEYKYDIFYNAIDSIVYGEEHNSNTHWLAGFEKDDRIIWSPYKVFQNASLNKSHEGFYETDFGRSAYYVTQIPIPKTNWNVVAAVPKWPILKPLVMVYMIVFAFIITSAVIFIYSLKYLNKRLLKPISFLDRSTKDIATGRFEIEYPYNINNEIGSLVRSFQRMATDIKKSQEQISKMSAASAIGQSAAMIAHDIRKPFSGLKTLISVLPDKKDDPVFIQRSMKEVENSLGKANAMIEDILEFSKNAEPKASPYNLQPLITAALVEVFRSGNFDSDIKFEYSLESMNYALGDMDKLQRVIENIIANAVEAMGGKGVIRFGVKDVRKDETTDMIQLMISNDGPEIPEAVQSKIFEPFFSSGKRKGTGLGLAICQKIVNNHGGSIYVVSNPDETSFVILLPAKQGSLQVNRSDLILHSRDIRRTVETPMSYSYWINRFLELHGKRGEKSTLLIVDDEPLFREGLHSLVSSISELQSALKVVEVDCGEKALELFGAERFDYVVSDIDMGKKNMNGYEFVRELLGKYPDVMAIIHSNKRRDEMDGGVKDIPGMMGFLPKPMSKEELLIFLSGEKIEDAVKEGRAALSELRKSGEAFAATNGAAGGRRNVLLVNDDEWFRVSVRILLKKMGNIAVLESGDVPGALDILKKEKVDIVLSDINLESNLNGYDLLRDGRQYISDGKFYFLSGYSKSEEEEKALSLGADGYIPLPLDEAELRKAVAYG